MIELTNKNGEKYLRFSGVMSKREKQYFLSLSDDESYRKAIEALYQRSQYLPEYIVRHGWWEKTKEWSEYALLGLTCGYGVKPIRPLVVGGTLIFSFTLFYFTGILIYPSKKYLIYQQKEEDLSIKSPGTQLYNCFYFSVITFTTLGYGDIQPKGGFKMVAMMEGVFGWIAMALFLVTLGNVWLR